MENIEFKLLDPEAGVVDVSVTREEAYGVVHQILAMLEDGEPSE